MRTSRILAIALLGLAIASSAFGQSAPPAAGSKLTIGLVLVGPYNDRGWSQANYDGLQYVKAKVPGVDFIYIDKANSADRPGTTVSQLAESLVSQGAKMIIFSSDDMMDEANKFAQEHPEIFVVMTTGDQSWKEGKAYKNLPNMINIMGKMEYMKMVAGVAAALTTKTGKIGFLGPLINDETRRLAASAYLGARYAWTSYLKKDPAKLEFKVTWIGFWFNIPGVTSDPTQVADDFFNSGYDVVISGIDTTEAVAEAAKFTAQGKKVWAIPYDYAKAIDEGKGVSLGVPFFNWGPAYAKAAKDAMAGTWKARFEWNGPDWKNINNPDTSAVGFNKGTLSKEASAAVDRFVAELAKGLNLWAGPLNLQDGSAYLKKGEKASDQQIWYLPQLLQGMQGQSVSK
ncbi:MAG TPA: BMP family ABC transporter substrate-binding protein [Spirochaetales bacterium]|nr:BMP family ABC transporter substrate-binding protein [Spirochaetales bacterium]HRY55583.1 BMP family ABC transporter substrate-binding protein [Spirochaetia bacterium]HRZ63450.1 BMP family ABC transporter substrate-binding protein [Spirochaetia bacterium]